MDFKVDQSNQAIEGTGLGLAISKSIIEAHGGELTIDSELGIKTVVTLTLPLTNQS